ncbi:hypothetical protein QQZ08_004629 [Neonectria magnoliae]|uniref:Nephrocystin 3-like N-terminal domain-containing protein n=1 Tax=Neonectria magnoliae TaxID=2732573 RepID=A0ABR1I5K7_9HYPO
MVFSSCIPVTYWPIRKQLSDQPSAASDSRPRTMQKRFCRTTCTSKTEHSNGTFVDPGQEKDAFYQVDDAGTERLMERERRPDSRRTRVWYGPIGSGEKLMKNARKRNELRDKHNIIGLEMEAAGTMNRIPVGVIRGVCDYGDEHKNKEWQPFAASMAAAYAKAVLAEIPPKSVERKEGPTIRNGMEHRPKRRLDECVTDGRRQRPYYEHDNQCLENFSDVNQTAPGSLDEEQKRGLLESLRFEQSDARHENIKKAHAKTCKWLLKKPKYLEWLDPNKLCDHHGFLWIKGKPGAGKSTLMKFVLNNARTRMKDSTIIACFFNARGDDLEKSTIGIGPQHWSVESLKALFDQAVQGLGKSSLVCFIDVLDECDEHQIRDMISFFEHMGQLTTLAGIAFRVCFSSRHYPHITISKGLSLVLEGQEGHDQDIVSYLDSELKIGHSKVSEQIRVDLEEKASGVFMWIVLVVGILQREYDHGRKHMLRQKLRDIPGDLHALFRDILTRDHHNKGELHLCIQWVLFARQPLKPEQLYYAVLVGVDPEVVSDLGPDEIEEADINNYILSSSKGLAEVTRSKKSQTVQFIHESVRDFLLKEKRLEEIWSGLGRSFQGESHERLKQCCLDYMGIGIAGLSISTLPKASSQEAAETRQSADKAFPFLEYATRNVLYHADVAERDGVSQTRFLQNFQLVDWIKYDNLFERYEMRRHTPEASLLYILAEHNLASLIGSYSSNLSCFQVEGERYGPPILAALAIGSREAVWTLLKAQAETKPLTSPLHGLCEQYYQDRNKRLSIGRDFRFPRQQSLLSYVTESGDESMVAFILASDELNTGIDSMDTFRRTPLSYAAWYGREAVVQLLLDRGAAIEIADKDGKTPLLYATWDGNKAVVQLLLDWGAAIKTADKDGRTPLQYAAKSGHKGIVKLLQ